MDHPTTTSAALAIAALLALVAHRYYRRSRQLARQIEMLDGEIHMQRQTLTQTQAARDSALRCVNLLQQANELLANEQRPVTIMRFNGVDYVSYHVKATYRN